MLLAQAQNLFPNRYVLNQFTEEHRATAGIDFKLKEEERIGPDNKLVRVQIWDLPGVRDMEGGDAALSHATPLVSHPLYFPTYNNFGCSKYSECAPSFTIRARHAAHIMQTQCIIQHTC